MFRPRIILGFCVAGTSVLCSYACMQLVPAQAVCVIRIWWLSRDDVDGQVRHEMRLFGFKSGLIRTKSSFFHFLRSPF